MQFQSKWWLLLILAIAVVFIWRPCLSDLLVQFHPTGDIPTSRLPDLHRFSLTNIDKEPWPQTTVVVKGTTRSYSREIKAWQPHRRINFPKTFPGDKLTIHVRQSWRCKKFNYVSD